MTHREPVLKIYGPLHALSARGLHVRQSARSWKLVVPLSADFLEGVRAFCESAPRAEAARLLLLLHFMGSSAELPEAFEQLGSLQLLTLSEAPHPCC